ncbi:MAG TPA: Minf_1886 family protein [Terrimicrobiaceae bacterium]
MQTVGFQEALERLLAHDSRYHPDAYIFLRDTLEATLKRRKKTRKELSPHVGAAELLDGFRLHGLQEFGPMAITVFDYWGVHASEDIGNMVFNLVQIGIFGKTDEDTPESFRHGYDFVDAFVLPFRPAPEKLSVIGSGVVGKKS